MYGAPLVTRLISSANIIGLVLLQVMTKSFMYIRNIRGQGVGNAARRSL